MANTTIYPFGTGGELPEGVNVVNNLHTESAANALSAAMGARLNAMLRGKDVIFVAASDATDGEKLAADYMCSGTNDERVIQAAITALYNKKGGKLILSSGTFVIDSFPIHDSSYDGGCEIAIQIPSNNTDFGFLLEIIGDGLPYLPIVTNSRGTQIKVSDTCYENLDQSKKYKIFCCTYSSSLIGKAKLDVSLSRFKVSLPWNQKKICCIDLRSANRVSVEQVQCKGFTIGYNGYSNSDGLNPPPIAAEDCIGLRMTGGSNYGILMRYYHVDCAGFYEGIQVGGEHVVGINLSGCYNVYSFTFGNYPWQDSFHHPITLINCSDERSVNMPLFAYCGDNRHNNEGGQQITMIDFNFERYAPQTPGGQIGEWATEIKPGTFHGEITYTTQVQGNNSATVPFWKDGHGTRFITRNSAHRLACSSSVRRGYAPNYLQRIWDTDLNKEVICTNTANKEWRDTMGNIV